ncbi:error-prone DNA polymerase [Alsobacter sp. SYSU M60028]|uniref:Error-prone DNA polymerase n=1 Tax=Alsobacter ponti TaxID=2962936 RepID=A0ABT1L8T7_9HYPH|nr:error-prone DNA polymerase [Alsobacter ponti]MCP8937904.1 error-prone DNA polymerase [Alsobacter ponti]
MTAFAELAAATNFSFLTGASHPEEMVARAAALGLAGLGVADRNTLAGVVRAHVALKETGAGGPGGPRLAVGARLVFMDGTPDVLAFPRDRAGYGRLCRLLTLGKRRARKGECHLRLDDLLALAEEGAGPGAGLNLAAMPARRLTPAEAERLAGALARLAPFAPGALWLAATMPHGGADRRRLHRLAELAAAAGVKLLASNDPLYHEPERRPLQDVLACIREHVTIDAAGRLLEAHAERHLKSPEEMARLFRHAPEAVAETVRFLDGCRFSLDELRYEYPDEPTPPGATPQGHLERLTWEGAARRYPAGVPEAVRAALVKELALIAQLGYAPYFLTVNDIVAHARGLGILCQGRGSAANSAVCYCLGVTAVDPTEIDLLFERFVSAERREPPDIDVDFEHERREEVIQWIYQRYGRERAGLAATVISYRSRSAIRDVGKALGLTEDITAAMANTVWGSWGKGMDEAQVRQAGLDPANPAILRAVDFATRLQGFPRHLSQHVGGFVLTRGRLDELAPIGNAAMDDRTFIEWDKDDIDALGIMKVDVLALGMLTCIRKALDMLREHGRADLELATIPREDPQVYAMLQRADSLGVFQVESRAQMNMLPRLRPERFYDLVIEVAIVRPGPIQGDMVHPYLKRRQNREKVVYPRPAPEHGPADELERVLGKTLGVPLFQEQAMRIAIEAAKFSPDEANRLRRAMATFRRVGTIHLFQRKMVEGMVRRGYDADFAARCFQQIEGFGEYGFPESHAASFALLVYASSWLKLHHPAAFAAALLNSQPMGFYAPAQIVRDAVEHGVEARAPDVNASRHDCTLEERDDGALALRLGLRQIDGFREDWARRIVERRGAFYDTVETLQRRAGLSKAALVRLAEADAMRSMGLDRREAAWAVRRLPDDIALPLFEAAGAAELAEEPATALPAMPLPEHVVADYQTLRLSLKGHPMGFLRPLFAREGALACRDVANLADGRRARAAGVVLVRQQPGSARGVVFMTIEDETGIANCVVWPTLREKYRREVMGARLIVIEGRAQRSPEGIVHVVAERLVDRSAELGRLSERALDPPLANADEVRRPIPENRVSGGHSPRRHPRDVRVLPKSRDFH